MVLFITYYLFSSLLNFITSLFAGLIIIMKSVRTERNMTFSFFCLSVSFWSFFHFIWQICNNHNAALLMSRILMMSTTFIPVFLYHSLAVFTNEKKSNKK